MEGFKLVVKPGKIRFQFPNATQTKSQNVRIIGTTRRFSALEQCLSIEAIPTLQDSEELLLNLSQMEPFKIPQEVALAGMIVEIHGIYDGVRVIPFSIEVLDNEPFNDRETIDILLKQTQDFPSLNS